MWPLGTTLLEKMILQKIYRHEEMFMIQCNEKDYKRVCNIKFYFYVYIPYVCICVYMLYLCMYTNANEGDLEDYRPKGDPYLSLVVEV